MGKKNNISIEGRTRIDILNAAYNAGKNGAHIAPSLSDVEICLAILKNFDKTKDSFILSKGHGALGYYAAMHQCGYLTDDQFESFEENGGKFPGQPSKSKDNNIECSSGSLGMGLSYGLGVALDGKDKGKTVYVVLGDGELNEGSNWEAAALAARYHLDNLIAIVDQNNLQSDGFCNEIVGQRLEELWTAFGWKVISCNGHLVKQIIEAFQIKHDEKPLAVLAHTVKGKGVSFMENNNTWHHAVLKDEDYEKAVQEIEAVYGLF